MEGSHFLPFPFSFMHTDISNSKGIAKLALRVSFGLSILFVGITHYMTMDAFVPMVTDGLGALQFLGTLWAYVLPGLMIVSGVLFTIGMYDEIAAWAGGLALGSIPAGMLLKPILSGVALGDMMPVAVNTFVWVLIYYFVAKSSCCGNCGPNGKK